MPGTNESRIIVESRTVITVNVDGREFEIVCQPIDGSEPLVRSLPDGRTVIGYLAQDGDPVDPLDGDGLGQVFDLRRGELSRERAERTWADPGPAADRLAVLLDVYDHSGETWSVAGEGHECRWDTSHNAGVWLADKCCIEHIQAEALHRLLPEGTKVSYEREGEEINVITYTLPDGTKRGGFKSFSSAYHAAAKVLGVTFDRQAVEAKQREVAMDCARQAVTAINQVASGEVYGVCVEVFGADGERLENDACWGHLGHEYAEQELRRAFHAVQ